ncbi:hypothetical protein [Streptomyces sp. NPDC005302]|uniref:hypothetical protein n=1 Tax=Streptomyces sp. NPDC005302 TaxID=3154675 RepID=UPI0033B0C760
MPEWLIASLADLTPTSAVLLAIALFSGSLVPFFLLVEAEHLTPRWLRDAPLSLAAALLVLTAPIGAAR